MSFISVDLPAPFGPTIATCSPGWMRSVRPLRARRSPRCTNTFSNSSNGGEFTVKGLFENDAADFLDLLRGHFRIERQRELTRRSALRVREISMPVAQIGVCREIVNRKRIVRRRLDLPCA